MIVYYTGVGVKKDPQSILILMNKIAQHFSSYWWILRSGGAQGADTAFESGASEKEIFYADDATDEAIKIASEFHPAWDRLSEYVKKLHGRNVFQVLGKDLSTPSKFLVCWTPDGAINHSERSIHTGGTGTAISIASVYNVPVFNLKRKDHFDIIMKELKRS
ncbi:MAG TPA: hypothetical protein PLI22_01130 [Caldisericia bacterium]|nr:hypothetical protein [Caldisericia bacterium]